MTEIINNDLYGKSGIYAIVNNLDGKMYIGRTIDLHKRKVTHFWCLRENRHDNIQRKITLMFILQQFMKQLDIRLGDIFQTP